MEKFFWAFVVGGGICVIGQLMMDVLRLTPAHTTSTLVVIGAILGGLGLYEPLVKFAGAGASVPISSFGNALVKGALAEAVIALDPLDAEAAAAALVCSVVSMRRAICRSIASEVSSGSWEMRA